MWLRMYDLHTTLEIYVHILGGKFKKWFFADLKMMTDVAGNPEEERRTDFYYQPWAQEAVCRYFYQKIQQKRAELDSALGIKNSA